jgi:hypothetical protein
MEEGRTLNLGTSPGPILARLLPNVRDKIILADRPGVIEAFAAYAERMGAF